MATLDLLSLAEAKLALNLSGTTVHDAELPAWITASSLMLDDKVGPVVRRTITGELRPGGAALLTTVLYPVTSFTTVTEYLDTVGTVLTRETNVSKPDSAYFAEPYAPDPTLFSGVLRRRSAGSNQRFAAGSSNVEITYVAGRFPTTATVDERFKSAGRLILSNLWNSQRPNLAQVGEFEIPQGNYPRFAVPNAVKEMLFADWHAESSGLMVG